MTRNYATEMRAMIDAEAQGTYSSPVVAQQIVDKLRATDLDLLMSYLAEHTTKGDLVSCPILSTAPPSKPNPSWTLRFTARLVRPAYTSSLMPVSG